MDKHHFNATRRLAIKTIATAPLLYLVDSEAIWFGLISRLFFGNVARQIPRSVARITSRSVSRRQFLHGPSFASSDRGRERSFLRDAYDVYSIGKDIADIVKELDDGSGWFGGLTNTASVVLANEGSKPVQTKEVTLTMRDILNDERFGIIFDSVEVAPNSAVILEADFPPQMKAGKKILELNQNSSGSDGEAGRIYREIVVAEHANSQGRVTPHNSPPTPRRAPLGTAGQIFQMIPD